MAFTIVPASVRYFDLGAGSTGLCIITGAVDVDGGTTTGVLNPVSIGALSGVTELVEEQAPGMRQIIYATAVDEDNVAGVQSTWAYDATTDSDQATLTFTANAALSFFMIGRKTA